MAWTCNVMVKADVMATGFSRRQCRRRAYAPGMNCPAHGGPAKGGGCRVSPEGQRIHGEDCVSLFAGATPCGIGEPAFGTKSRRRDGGETA